MIQFAVLMFFAKGMAHLCFLCVCVCSVPSFKLCVCVCVLSPGVGMLSIGVGRGLKRGWCSAHGVHCFSIFEKKSLLKFIVTTLLYNSLYPSVRTLIWEQWISRMLFKIDVWKFLSWKILYKNSIYLLTFPSIIILKLSLDFYVIYLAAKRDRRSKFL